MMFIRYLLYATLTLAACLISKSIFAQGPVPVGQWRTHFSYNSANSIEKVNDLLYVAESNLYSFSLVTNEYTIYSKVNGLSDVDIQLIRYDQATDNLVIIYQNGNIDLLQQGKFSNIPDIKNLNITGSKRINSIYFKNRLIYLCTDFGIVVLNPERKEIKETYVLQDGPAILSVFGLSSLSAKFYAATSKGLYVADELSSSLQNFASWTSLSVNPISFLFLHKNQLFGVVNKTLYKINGPTFSSVYEATGTISMIKPGQNDIYVCEQGDLRRAIMILDQDGALIDSAKFINPKDVVETNTNEIWEADEWEGLILLSDRKNRKVLNPNGLYANSINKLRVVDEDIYVSGGGQSGWNPLYNRVGFSRFKKETWDWFNIYRNFPAMDSVLDLMDIAVDKRNGFIYASSYGGGLLEIHPDNTMTVYKNNGYIQGQLGNPQANILVGLVFDKDNNLWMSNYSAPDQMVVKKADGSWQKFSFPYTASEKSASEIIIDNANQKWMIAPRGIGLFVLNDNNSIDNKNDDQIRLLNTGTGNGNLPNNDITSIALDKNGKIWVGTTDGVGIINCPESIMSSAGCDAELKIVKYDLSAGLLFQREIIKAIAVDGANNKWIGTNNGVWLISDDAEKIIHRFTKDNSPLPSNEIISIAIQPISGEVFIGTEAGLISYRGEATDGSSTNDNLLVFPNPVPSKYAGQIAIKGLVENADVRITDVNGQLVYRTKAQGGQAIWNGKNYLGDRPRTGVMFVFVTNNDGTQTKTGKFIFNE